MKSRRMFLGLWPNEEQIDQLYAVQSAYTQMGREVPPENFHITLLFLGNISNSTVESLRHGLSDLMIQPFSVRLDRLGYFDKTKIFWIGPTHVPEQMNVLFKNVRQQAQRCEIRHLTKKYVPHTTLLRQCEGLSTDPILHPIDWYVDEFHLIESRMEPEGAQYYTVDTFPLMNHS